MPRRSPPTAPVRPTHPPAWLLVAPTALAVAAYARALGGEFLLDDFHAIVQNPAVKDLGASLRRLLPALLTGGRPVAELTFALDYASAGLDPFRFHLTGLAVHLAVVGLAFAFTRAAARLAEAPRPEGLALAAAGIFALHPLQTEAVSYVVQRSETLASGLYLATLLLLLEAARRGLRPSGALAWLGALVAFALGLGAKAVAVTAPLAFLLLAALAGPRARRALPSWPKQLLLLAPLALAGVLFGRSAVAGTAGAADAGFSVPGLSPWIYLLSQTRAVATYLRLLFVPVGQTFCWPTPPARGLAEPTVLGAGLLLLGLLGGAIALGRWARPRPGAAGAAGRMAALGVLWFFLVLAPTSSVLPLADLAVEHRVYLACWGPLLAVVAGLDLWLARWPRRRRAALVGGAWIALAALTWHRNAAWESPVALWSDAVAKAPWLQRPHLDLGIALWQRGEFEGAAREFRQALDRGGRSTPSEEAFIQNDLGLALLGAGRLAEAGAALERASELEPRSANALGNLALVRLRQGDLAAAEAAAARALALDPSDGGALVVLGEVRLGRGDAAGAIEPLERAVRGDPDDADRWLELASALERAGRSRDACAALRRVLRLRAPPSAKQRATERAAALACAAN